MVPGIRRRCTVFAITLLFAGDNEAIESDLEARAFELDDSRVDEMGNF
jgi:hypothetical protein